MTAPTRPPFIRTKQQEPENPGNELSEKACAEPLWAAKSDNRVAQCGAAAAVTTVEGDTGEGPEWELGAGAGVDEAEDDLQWDGAADKEPADPPHQELREACLGPQEP